MCGTLRETLHRSKYQQEHMQSPALPIKVWDTTISRRDARIRDDRMEDLQRRIAHGKERLATMQAMLIEQEQRDIKVIKRWAYTVYLLWPSSHTNNVCHMSWKTAELTVE